MEIERHIKIIADCVRVKAYSEAYVQWTVMSKEHPHFMGNCLTVMNFLVREAREISKVVKELAEVLKEVR